MILLMGVFGCVAWGDSLACCIGSLLKTVGRELSFGRCITVGLCSSVLEIFCVSCVEKPGADLLLCKAIGWRSFATVAGSDSPSNTATLVSRAKDASFRRQWYVFARAISGALGH